MFQVCLKTATLQLSEWLSRLQHVLVMIRSLRERRTDDSEEVCMLPALQQRSSRSVAVLVRNVAGPELRGVGDWSRDTASGVYTTLCYIGKSRSSVCTAITEAARESGLQESMDISFLILGTCAACWNGLRALWVS
jgi:hypothetical protein